MNSTRKPHKIDDNFAILEVSQKTKRVRIGVGNEETQTLTNTIKFSISEGQKVLGVRTTPQQIWIQADNARMTILKPNHEDQKVAWTQTYTYSNSYNLTFTTFDVFRIKSELNGTGIKSIEMSYPCRNDKCQQLCRDETQHIFAGETKLNNTDGKYVCSCTRDFYQDDKYPDQCHEMPKCHHQKLMCDYDQNSDAENSVKDIHFKCIGREQFCDGTPQCADKHDESDQRVSNFIFLISKLK